MSERPTLETATPEVRSRITDSFDKQGLMAHLGARLTHVGPGRVHISLPHRPEVTQQDGYVHAGATSAIADSAGGYAALTLFPEGMAVLTVEFTVNLLAPAHGDSLEAEGVVLRSGGTLTVCRVDVFAVRGDARTLVAAAQQTLIAVRDAA
jgi:uncharacterized protein (TIGR00369 family)